MNHFRGLPRLSSCLVAIACATLVGVALPRPVRADAASESQLQFDLGSEFYRQHRYGEAVERFLSSYRLVPNANVAFNIAQTYSLLRRQLDVYNWCEIVAAHDPPEALQALAAELRDRVAPRVAVIDVSSTPPGAEIFVDREDLGARGRTPRRLAVEPGPRTVIVRLSGHQDGTASVVATAGSIVPARVDLAPIVSRVRVTTVPAGARVTLDPSGRDLGTSPLEVELPIGSHRLRATLDRYGEATDDVVVTDDAPRDVTIRLARASGSFATLSIAGEPAGARVLLAGRSIGTVPLTRSDLAPGRSSIEVSAPGREPYRSPLLLEAGSATRLHVELRPPPSWSWPTWRIVLWTTAGAALAAGGVLGGLALSERSAFFDDPTRNAYDSVGTYALAADVLFATGAVLAIGTFVWNLLLSRPRGTEGHVEVER